MKASLNSVVINILYLPGVISWGGLGHNTTAYLAEYFVSNSTAAFFQELLRNNNDDYLGKIAMFGDDYRNTAEGHFTKEFHFIDAHDDPYKSSCNVDYARDCKETGCVISALANYTQQVLDHSLDASRRALAAKLVVHYIGDLHQPLHNEDVAQGGTNIRVKWESEGRSLHQVWDTSIPEKLTTALHARSDQAAVRWAKQLAFEIIRGKFSACKYGWLKDFDMNDTNGTAMAWSREANALVCSHVFPFGNSPQQIAGKELSDTYYVNAGPAVEKQVARAGLRMAAWLNGIAEKFMEGNNNGDVDGEL